MKIHDIYDRYDIMPNLREHQLRVTAVALFICDHLPQKDFSERDLVSACLLHDMGNIIKADFSVFPEFFTPEEIPKWEEIKKKMKEKYQDEHRATLAIANELGVGEQVIAYLENARFFKFNIKETNLAVKIYNYADMRVSPHGITSLHDRLEDLRVRNKKNDEERAIQGLPLFDRESFHKRMFEFEEDIFSVATCIPTEITNESVASIIEMLADFDIETFAS